jgi:superfamily I DNA/RNA helicase
VARRAVARRTCRPVRHGWAQGSFEALSEMLLTVLVHRADEWFSDATCSLFKLMTAHSVKGMQARSVYILQPQMFPLERALNDGPVALSQEPRVAYVANTRATHNLYVLAEASGQEDDDLETVLFEL